MYIIIVNEYGERERRDGFIFFILFFFYICFDVQAAENETGAFNERSKIVRPDSLELPEQLPAQYKNLMRTWLENRGSCSVEYMWVDLGKSFWPRWIKKGRCDRSEMMSCSWPPGMSCMPSSIRVLNLLRWHCW